VSASNAQAIIPKAGRQGTRAPKTRYHCLLTNDNYDFLCQLALAEGLSVAAVLNKLLLDMRRRSA
jgi:hypothetical protein